jgi:hypothetical protein
VPGGQQQAAKINVNSNVKANANATPNGNGKITRVTMVIPAPHNPRLMSDTPLGVD